MATEEENTVVLNALLEDKTREMVVEQFGTEAGIITARICHDVLRHFEIPSRAVACWMRVHNAAFQARMDDGQEPVDEAEIEQWFAEDGSWNVGIGGLGLEEPGRFGGHLVVVADRQILLDPTLDQVNRIEKGIDLRPLALRVPEGWVDGDPHTIKGELNGCTILYSAQTDKLFAETVAWRDKALRGPLVDAFIADIDTRLADL